jgi:hypothetical protein
MTAQMSDSLTYQDRKCHIAGVNGDGLFRPEDYDLEPVATCTACWRGFVCHYALKEKTLILDGLEISLAGGGRGAGPWQGPEINGVKPVGGGMFDNVYNNLDLDLDFTGGMLLAEGFIWGLYVHMGFHPAWKYEEVIELIIDRGKLVEARNVSARMRELRNKLKKAKKPLRPDPLGDPNEVTEWIKSTFRLDYGY